MYNDSSDFTDEELDDTILKLGAMFDAISGVPSRVNIDNVKKATDAHAIAMRIFGGNKDVKVELNLHKPYKWMGSVKITGRDIKFEDTRDFLSMCNLAGMYDVYGLTNGNTCLAFTFHGLTSIISPEGA